MTEDKVLETALLLAQQIQEQQVKKLDSEVKMHRVHGYDSQQFWVSSRTELEEPQKVGLTIPSCTSPESLGSPLEVVLMGNITERGSKGRAADGPQTPGGGTAATVNVQLCEAIMQQDCTALRALLRSHPVNQPVTVPVDPTGCSMGHSRLYLNQVLASPARSLSALSTPRAVFCRVATPPSQGPRRKRCNRRRGSPGWKSLPVVLSSAPRLRLCAGVTSPFLAHTFFIV